MEKTLFILLAATAAFPLLAVNIDPDQSSYVFRAEVSEKIIQTAGGKLEYFYAENIEGTAPADNLVIVTDKGGYTRGEIREGENAWLQGDLMDEETYFGEQYLFFGKPQIYVSQVKKGLFWPDQKTEARILYESPFSSFASLLFVWAFPFMEEFSLLPFLVLVFKTILVVAVSVLMTRSARKRDPKRLLLLFLAYSLAAMALTLPVLRNFY